MNTKNEITSPNRFWLSLTGSCNLKCNWCYRTGSENRVFMDINTAFRAIDCFAECGVRACTIIGMVSASIQAASGTEQLF